MRVIAFSYSESTVGAVWGDLRRAIAQCPRTTEVREDDGSRGTATLTMHRAKGRMIRTEVVTRSKAGAYAWSEDRLTIYQAVGDAIQAVQVSRRILTARDRAFAARVARVSAARYRRAVTPRPTGPGTDDGADAALAAALANVPPGATVNVAMGDSMASGEAGRWRGNVFSVWNWAQSDAYGPQAYWDTPTGESIPGCHRAKGAGINVPGTYALNLACSGAKTTSMWSTSPLDYGQYKPGLDEGAVNPSTGARMPGQLTLLAQVARRVRVGTIVMSIGGNDMGFADVITACIADFMRPWPFERRCQDNSEVQARLSPASLALVEQKVAAAIVRVNDTMQGAARAASAATGQPVQVMDLTGLFAGRELCARGAEHVDQVAPGAVTARAERVQMVRVLPPFGPTEGMHPNQIGQQALQACVREAINGGAARSGRCDAPLDWSQVDSSGLPLVRFTPTS